MRCYAVNILMLITRDMRRANCIQQLDDLGLVTLSQLKKETRASHFRKTSPRKTAGTSLGSCRSQQLPT